MLKGIYGSQSKVLNTESMKKFQQCFICLQTLENPFCCSKGHVFCKDCIMNNLLRQKKKIKKVRKELELTFKRESEEKRQMEELGKEIELQIKRNKNDDFALRQTIKEHNNNLNKALKIDEKEKLKIAENKLKEQLQRKEVFDYDNKIHKKQLAQTSFWIGGNGIPSENQIIDQKFSNPADKAKGVLLAIKDKESENKTEKVKKPKVQLKMICPGDNVHKIKLSHLFKLSIKNSENNFICKYCEKLLNFQKISCLKECGHVYCTKCLAEIPGKHCLCGKKIKNKKIVHLKESQSGFGSHNKTEVKVYTRAFMG